MWWESNNGIAGGKAAHAGVYQVHQWHRREGNFLCMSGSEEVSQKPDPNRVNQLKPHRQMDQGREGISGQGPVLKRFCSP